jgi:putative transposase
VTDNAVAELAPHIGARLACDAVGATQAGYYRRHRHRPAPERSQPIPHRDRQQPRALTEAEEQAILAVLHSDRFVDVSPTEVWAILLDEGVYLGSISTFYRLLRRAGETRERRRQATHPAKVKPELVATSPNQVWSWDITKLHGPWKGTYHHLYVIIDIYSRYVVGWMVASRESEHLAEVLIRQTCAKQGIDRAQLTIHADRGSSMTSKTVTQLLADLGITQSHGRPHVSNDNPYSESQFKTLKYRPDFPGQFGSIEAARRHCQRFFSWYNDEHRHSGIGLHTPADVHYSTAEATRDKRAGVLAVAYTEHPRTIRTQTTRTTKTAHRVLDQPTAARPARGGCSVNSQRRCLKQVDRFRWRSLSSDVG